MAGWNPFRRKCKLRVEAHEYHENDLTAFLEKGDIILYRGQYSSFTSALIMEFTRSPYSHVEIYIGDGWSISAEAYGISLEDHCNTGFIDIMRSKEVLSREKLGNILQRAYESLSKPYEYLGLIGFPFGSEKAAARRSANEAYICSEVTAWCYQKAGIDLIENKPEAIEAPADLANSPKLQWLGAWKAAKPFPAAVNNKIHPSQLDKKAGFAKWLVKNVADLLSERDDYYERLRDEHEQKNREKHYKQVEAAFIISQKESQESLLKVATSD
jgi:cell wall-associated NlpC family hydrolase